VTARWAAGRPRHASTHRHDLLRGDAPRRHALHRPARPRHPQHPDRVHHDGLTEIVRTAYATPTTTGFEITLPINDDIDPAGTTWKLRVARLSWTFQLHAAHAGQRVSLRSVIVDAPTNPAPMVAGVTRAELDAALAALGSGGTGGTVTAIDGGNATSTGTDSIDGGSAAA
jgi:hypothetical protein